jgi:hypothetical protein
MELAPTPVNVAEGDEVSLPERDPPGALELDALAVVVVTVDLPLATVVVVLLPLEVAVVVVVVAEPAGAAVVDVVEVVADEADFTVLEVDFFLLALGVELPQAAAISPAVTMTAPILAMLKARLCSRCDVWAQPLLLFKVICPHSMCGLDTKRGAAGDPG